MEPPKYSAGCNLYPLPFPHRMVNESIPLRRRFFQLSNLVCAVLFFVRHGRIMTLKLFFCNIHWTAIFLLLCGFFFNFDEQDYFLRIDLTQVKHSQARRKFNWDVFAHSSLLIRHFYWRCQEYLMTYFWTYNVHFSSCKYMYIANVYDYMMGVL